MGRLCPWGITTPAFTAYPLPLTRLLYQAFAVGLRLQTASPLISPLVLHGLLDGFAADDPGTRYAFLTRIPF